MKLYYRDIPVFTNRRPPHDTLTPTRPSEIVRTIFEYVGTWGDRSASSLYVPWARLMASSNPTEKAVAEALLQCLDTYAAEDRTAAVYDHHGVINLQPLYGLLGAIAISRADDFGQGVSLQDVRALLTPTAGAQSVGRGGQHQRLNANTLKAWCPAYAAATASLAQWVRQHPHLRASSAHAIATFLYHDTMDADTRLGNAQPTPTPDHKQILAQLLALCPSQRCGHAYLPPRSAIARNGKHGRRGGQHRSAEETLHKSAASQRQGRKRKPRASRGGPRQRRPKTGAPKSGPPAEQSQHAARKAHKAQGGHASSQGDALPHSTQPPTTAIKNEHDRRPHNETE